MYASASVRAGRISYINSHTSRRSLTHLPAWESLCKPADCDASVAQGYCSIPVITPIDGTVRHDQVFQFTPSAASIVDISETEHMAAGALATKTQLLVHLEK